MSTNLSDTDTSAKLFRNHVLGGATIPEHWFGGAGDVNRATGEDMSGPTFKMMSMRQAFIGFILQELAKYVIRQWHLATQKTEPDFTDERFKVCVHWPEMVAKDTTRYASALQQVTQAVSQGISEQLLSRETGLKIIQSIAGRLGVEFDADTELEAIAKNPPVVTNAENPPGQKIPPGQSPGKVSANQVTEAVSPKRNDPPSDLAEQLARRAQPKIDGMLASVAAMLESVDTLREAQTRLDQMFPDLASDDLAELLAQGIVAANLVGRADIDRGA